MTALAGSPKPAGPSAFPVASRESLLTSVPTPPRPDQQPPDRLVSEYETFARLPEWVLNAPLSDRAVRLFAILLRYADQGGTAWPSRATLARRLRPAPSPLPAAWRPLSVDSVDRAVAELVAAGAVRVERNGGKPGDPFRSNTYRLLRPPSRTGAATPSRTRADTLAARVRNEREPKNESQEQRPLSSRSRPLRADTRLRGQGKPPSAEYLAAREALGRPSRAADVPVRRTDPS